MCTTASHVTTCKINAADTYTISSTETGVYRAATVTKEFTSGEITSGTAHAIEITGIKFCTFTTTITDSAGAALTGQTITITDPSNTVSNCSTSSNVITCLAKMSGTYTASYAGTD